MADLPVNFKDDILAASMGGKRRYNIIQNEDGTISLEDVTTYQQEGSNFGAAQVNATNGAVNGKVDLDNVISTLEELQAVTEPGFWIDALVAKSLYSNLKIELSSGAILVRSGNIVELFLFNCTSIPNIPGEHLPENDRVTNLLVSNSTLVRIIIKSDGTKQVYEGANEIKSYNLYGTLIWIAKS